MQLAMSDPATPYLLALYEPDIAQNAGAIMRTCACLGVDAAVIEPAGFRMADSRFRRAGMDYLSVVRITSHDSWAKFLANPARNEGRLVLFTTKGAEPYQDFAFAPGDTLLFGRESAGVPDDVHAAADARLFVPIRPETRSLNVIVAAAMGLGEALRQTGGFA